MNLETIWNIKNDFPTIRKFSPILNLLGNSWAILQLYELQIWSFKYVWQLDLSSNYLNIYQHVQDTTKYLILALYLLVTSKLILQLLGTFGFILQVLENTNLIIELLGTSEFIIYLLGTSKLTLRPFWTSKIILQIFGTSNLILQLLHDIWFDLQTT